MMLDIYPNWPIELPRSPLFPDGWKITEAARQPDETEANTGDVNRRNNTIKLISRVQAAWNMDTDQLASFWSFWNTTLSRGTCRFLMDVHSPYNGFLGFVPDVVCMMRTHPDITALTVYKFRVAVELDVEFPL